MNVGDYLKEKQNQIVTYFFWNFFWNIFLKVNQNDFIRDFVI